MLKKSLAVLLSMLMLMSALPLSFGISVSAAKTVSVLDGQVSITDEIGNGTVSNGVVTVIGTKGGTFSSGKTNTITITNETENTATLTFDYSAKGYKSFSEASSSGTKSVILNKGESITMSIQGSGGFLQTVSDGVLTLSNFSLVPVAASSSITFEYDSTLGSITANGNSFADGETIEGISKDTGIALVATAASGVQFLGWTNAANGAILSSAASFTFTPTSDITVKAVFINQNSTPHFMIGAMASKKFSYGLLGFSSATYYTVSAGTHIFDDLNAAAQASAQSTTSKGIVLLNESTLPAGEYTIPAGSTLLIPFDSANTLYKDMPEGRTHASTEKNTFPISYYRTLTMASGAHININGEISLSAKHIYAQGSQAGGGSPVDAVSRINMLDGSSITVNNGGKLYVYGYIYGDGTVTAKSGASVYENFQIMDFRGGTQSTEMENAVFPTSQYYIQNIESELTIEYGAKEYGVTTIYMSSAAFTSAVNFIGPNNSMFNLTSGKVTKKYDGSTDRLDITLDGNLTVSPLKLTVGTNTIDSKNYELPINGNISVIAKSGSNVTMNQDLAMLPSSEIIIDAGAKCTIGSGISIYIYDADNWGKFTAATATEFKPIIHAMTKTYTRTVADLVDATICVDGTIDASAGYVYTTAGGANVYSTGTGTAKVTAGTQTVTHQLVQGTGYTEIPITPVKLKNADGTYLQTASDTYTHSPCGWNYSAHSYVAGEPTAPTCNDPGFTTYTCSVCGDSYTEQSADALGHSYDDGVITAPTCDSEGYTTYTCTVCGNSYTDNTVSALEHNYEAVVTEPTCTEDGFTTYTCSACGDSYEGDRVTSKGHSYNAVVTEPTCTEDGFTTYTCSACGDSYTDNTVSALGHNHIGTETTAPTCDSEGVMTYNCSRCNDSYTESIDALGHSYSDEYTTDLEPTDLSEGSKSRHCANCSSVTDVTVIAAKTDFIANVENGKATITGYKTDIDGMLYIPLTLDGAAVSAIGENAFNMSADSFIVFAGSVNDWEAIEGSALISADIVYEGNIVGDVNGDNNITADDLTALNIILLSTDELSTTTLYTSDLNNDGKVSITDLIRFKKYFANVDVTLGRAY